MAAKSDSSFTTWAMGIFTLGVFGLASWSLLNSLNGMSRDAEIQEEMRLKAADIHQNIELLRQEVKRLADDKASEAKQDASIRKHWKLHTWVRDEIHELRQKNDMPTSKWPDFE